MKKILFMVCLLLVVNGFAAKRSYIHIPYAPKTPAMRTGIRSSTMKRICLNGKWDFLPIQDNKEFPNTPEFLNKIKNEKNIPPQNSKWDKILVPSMWSYYWGMAFLDDKGQSYLKKWRNIKRAWYRRKFTVPKEWNQNRRLILKFDAAAGFTKVFVNGAEIGSHYGSLFSFEFDITDKINYNKKNELLIYSVKRLRARRGEFTVELPDGRQNQYGIYRNVWLKNESDIVPKNTQIITSVRKKNINVSFELTNRTSKAKTIMLAVDIVESNGKIAKKMGQKRLTLKVGESVRRSFAKSWSNPKLWDVGKPNMYFTRIRIIENGKLICERQQRFGFREFWIKGAFFYLNGKRFTFRGDWIHTFWAGCPAEMYPDYMKLMIKQMKILNFQGPRFQAADAPEWLLDLLDEAGFPIISTGITPNYYGDPSSKCMSKIIGQTKQWIRRDRNHPSILLWSTMNEATAPCKFHPRFKWQKKVVNTIAKEDQTRPQYNDGHAKNTKPSDFFTTGNLAGELTISCGHYGSLKVCPNDYIGFLNAPKYWPRKRPFINGEEGVFGIMSMFYPSLAIRAAGIKGLFFDIEERRALSGRWLKLISHAWRAWEVPGFIGYDSFRSCWENPFSVIRNDYNRQYHKVAYLKYKDIDVPGPKGQLVIGHYRDDEPRANPWTKKYPQTKANSYAKYVKAAYAPVFATITRNWQSNYFSEDLVSKKIDLVNDLREDAKALSLSWNVYDGDKKIAGKTCVVDISQGKVIQEKLNFTVPKTTILKKLNLNVVLNDKKGKELSSETLTINVYPKPDFAFLKSRKIMIFDPCGDTSAKLSKVGIALVEFKASTLNIHNVNLLLIGREAFDKLDPQQKESLQKYIQNGGNVFFFRQKNKRKVSASLIDKSAPAHPIFNGLKTGMISNWKIKPDSENFKYPLNWPSSGRFNILALIGAESAGRHEAAIIENYIGKGRMIACNLELTASIPQEPEAMVLLSNILKEYSVSSKHSFKKTVYISNSDNNIFLKEPFFIDAEHFSSAFHNMDLSNVNTVILGELDKLNKVSQKIIKQKINEFRGNVLVLPQKNYSFVNSLLGPKNNVKIKKLKTCRGFRQNVQGIVGFFNKGKDSLSQGLESFFQTCQHLNKGVSLDILSALFENSKGWKPLLAPYDRLPGTCRSEYGVVPIKKQLLMSKKINGKNFVLSRLELLSKNPAINRIYLTLLTNLQVDAKGFSNKPSFSLEKGKSWMVNCGGFIYNFEGAAQLRNVSCAAKGDVKFGKVKGAGISLARIGFRGLNAPYWRFMAGMKNHPGDLGKVQLSGVKKDGKITIIRKGIMLDPKTQVKMKYESTINFNKDGKVQMSYDFKVINGIGKYKTAISSIRLDKDGGWIGKNVRVKDVKGNETLFKWPALKERCNKHIKAPKTIVFESANGIRWNMEVSSSFKYLTLRRGYHKGFELTFETEKWQDKLELKKGDTFTFNLNLYPQDLNKTKDENIFNTIKNNSILPMSSFERNSPNAKEYFFVNIVKKCNAAFSGQKYSEKKSSVFKLKDLKGGDLWLNGTPFHIIDADTDECEGGDPGQAMSMIIMKGDYRKDFPEMVKNIQVGQKAKKLYFLQSAVYMHSTSGKWDKKAKLNMWKYRINYEDGSFATVPVVHHVNVKDWYKQKSDLPGARIAYVEKISHYVGVWSQEWKNPHPGKVISSIDIESAGKGIPVILAISGKK